MELPFFLFLLYSLTVVNNYGRPAQQMRTLYFCLPCGFFFFLLFFFPRLISAVADWMSTILTHMVWP